MPVAAQRAKGAAAVTCATCHAGVVSSYAQAPMRHAIEPDGANPQLATHPDLKATIGGYSYSVQTKDGKTTYSVSDGANTITLPVHYFFGQKTQTWVLEKDGHLYEGMVSYFPRINGLDITPGDQVITPHTLEEAMGRKLPIWESRKCFECHGSGIEPGVPLEPAKIKPGLECEHCHVGAQQHMEDAAKDNFKTLPPSLKKLDSESLSNFCGQCHRSWENVVRNRWHGIAFVRFQPYRMALSRCFTGNDARIGCVACHDPHKPLVQDQKFYDSKCLACHGEQAHSVASMEKAPLPMMKTCPVAKENCVSCHMPKVELPGGHALFTDHFIRIVKPGEAYQY